MVEARTLFRAALCTGDEPLPANLVTRHHRRNCRALARAIERYRKRWLVKALEFFPRVVPSDLPPMVVYPFGGGDLVTALAVFPRATEYTTLSLEPAGDPRTYRSLRRAQIEAALDRIEQHLVHFLRENHSRTVDIGEVMRRGRLPGQLVFALLALRIHDCRPLVLRYFSIQPDGTLHYLTAADIAEAERGLPANQKLRRGGLRHLFANLELTFETPTGQVKTYRHIQANLDNAHLSGDPRVLRHLERKGRVAAMTKAASYLLWGRRFATIRSYLLGHMEWMVSDATGIPPRYARPAGFEQITWGRWRRHIAAVRNPGNGLSAEFRRLWERNPYQPLRFRFGYPDGYDGSPHLMVTRRKVPVRSAAGSALPTP